VTDSPSSGPTASTPTSFGTVILCAIHSVRPSCPHVHETSRDRYGSTQRPLAVANISGCVIATPLAFPLKPPAEWLPPHR
jgi:hypothetical protein